MHVKNRLTRLEKTLNQLEHEQDNTDPEMLITKLKVSYYSFNFN